MKRGTTVRLKARCHGSEIPAGVLITDVEHGLCKVLFCTGDIIKCLATNLIVIHEAN